MITRDQMAGALSSIPGLTGSPYRPQTPGSGAAWPVWLSTGVEQGGCARIVRWYVLAAQSAADEPTASEQAATLVELLIGTLRALGLVVELVEPVRLPIESGQAGIPALRVLASDHVWIGR